MRSLEEVNPHTSRERVRLSIGHREPDRVPRGEIIIDNTLIAKALKVPRVGFEEKSAFVNRLGLDLFCIHPDYPTTLRSVPEPEGLYWPHLEEWTGKTGLFIFGVLDGPFGWGVRSLGFKEFFMLPQRSPDVVSEFVRHVEGLNREWIRRLADGGVDGVIIADDIAYSRGLMAGPEILRNFFFPSLERMAEEADLQGLSAFFHSDGNTLDIIPNLVKMGFRGLHCIDPKSGMDIQATKEHWGKELCLWGSLAPEDLPPPGDSIFINRLKGAMEKLGVGGGFILGTTSGLFPGIDWEALERLKEGLSEA
ncbi:MAG: uroporphyrinogen decarboxylase family protein [Desulfatiglandales bacterium]